MIEGTINARYEAVIPVRIQGPDRRALEIEAVVDTGYNGFLTLPEAVVAQLALPYSHAVPVILADDTEAEWDVHRAGVLWDGQLRGIDAHAGGSTPLIGMLLLDGYNLNIDVKVGGRVVIQASP